MVFATPMGLSEKLLVGVVEELNAKIVLHRQRDITTLKTDLITTYSIIFSVYDS